MSGARPVSFAVLSGCESVQIAPVWSVTFTLVLSVLLRNKPFVTFPTTVAVIPPAVVVTVVVSFATEVFLLFHVMVTLVMVLPACANVAQFCGFVPFAEPFDVPLVMPAVPLQPLTGRLNFVVWIFFVVPRPGTNVTEPEGFAHVRTARRARGLSREHADRSHHGDGETETRKSSSTSCSDPLGVAC